MSLKMKIAAYNSNKPKFTFKPTQKLSEPTRIMQNKPNSKSTPKTLNLSSERPYINYMEKPKQKTNPIRTQSKPIQTQYEPNTKPIRTQSELRYAENCSCDTKHASRRGTYLPSRQQTQLNPISGANILLVNPAVYDFTAYDFWLKPYGMLGVGGLIGGEARFRLFDYLDRLDPAMKTLNPKLSNDKWNRGGFYSEKIQKPAPLADIPRVFRRFGLPREVFQDMLKDHEPLDFAFVQTQMTYWYLGVAEAIEDIRRYQPAAKIVLGGPYATICPEHARGLGGDLVIEGDDLEPLWQMLKLRPTTHKPPLWEAYPQLHSGVMKLTCGCPYSCTYCAVGQGKEKFSHRPLADCIADYQALKDLGVSDIAFYDDALLYKPQELLIPFMEHVIRCGSESGTTINLHTPNALHARFLTDELAELMVRAGFKTFYLGFESASDKWQKQTGGKVVCGDLRAAVEGLRKAGAMPSNIAAYQIVGHPDMDSQHLAETMEFANSLGIRVMLADFSPIPGTIDGERARKWTDIDEPLNHNKTAFPIRVFGDDTVNRLKDMCRALNNEVAEKEMRDSRNTSKT
jgi:hypothetical protein